MMDTDHTEIIKEGEAVVEAMALLQSRFRRICVFCGSSQGKKKSYQDAAVELVKELVRSTIFLNSHICNRLDKAAASFFNLDHDILSEILLL